MVGLRAPWGVEGGVESAVAELAPRLVRAGCEVTVYCRGRYNPYGSGFVEGVRLVDVPTTYSRSLEAFVHSAIAAPRAALRHDVVHLHACGPAMMAPLPRALGRRVVVTVHGKDWTRDKWGPVAKAVLRAGVGVAGRSASALMAVSRELRDYLASRYDVPVHFVPNGVAPHEPVAWDPGLFPSLRPGGYVLFVGRLVPEKDVLTLVRAAARTRLPVVITGGAAYTDAYVAQLRREAPANVLFTGPRFGDEKAMLLTHARAFALPSRVEGLPIALLEAMAAGLPTLVSDIGPNREALAHCGGWRLPTGDVARWGAALEEVAAADLAILRGIGAQGAWRVRERYGWDNVVRETLGVYQTATAAGVEREAARAQAYGPYTR
ncbi:MAG: glycosyltransferase family 4 protein [Myxococcota bacterium]